MKKKLLKKINSKNAIIGIFGLGYVGLPLMLRFTEVGYKVIGFEVDQHKIQALSLGQSYINHIDSSQIKSSIDKGFEVTNDYSRASELDAIILCLPTPLNSHKEPNLNFIKDTMESLLPYLKKGQIISLESTSYPGTTEEELLPRISAAGFSAGEDISL